LGLEGTESFWWGYNLILEIAAGILKYQEEVLENS